MKKGWVFWCAMTFILSASFSLLMAFKIAPITESAEFIIGLMVSILGLLITFVVGFQIYNAMEAKETLKEIGELKNVKADLEHFKHQIRAENYNDKGLREIADNEYVLAICYYVKGLYFSLKCNDEQLANWTVGNALVALANWDIEKPKHPFLCRNRSIDDKHPKDVISEYMKKIASDFKDNRLYKNNQKEFLDVERRFQIKIKEYGEN